MENQWRADLDDGLTALGIPFIVSQIDQVVEYIRLLSKWNKGMNMIARRDMSRIVSRHILDSCSAQSLIVGQRVLDLGTGGGLPGLPLAILDPQRHYVLCDRMERRQRFLFTVINTLRLSNVSLLTVDWNNPMARQGEFDTIIARALAPLQVLWPQVRDSLNPHGRLVVFSSTQLVEETTTSNEARVHRTEQKADAEQDFAREGHLKVQIPGLIDVHTIEYMERH
ncbi:MAG TPA: 16S rRNA (guanine(527)-N(7))-methyltransferase RsmG [Gammaproteobacteria bacterium]|nr:16S rRNA (guanine(527)-N(7))-methyltransferase RsmG [Gammaproteobacteria bacterium]|tara:strand:- start:10791 stop:11465 length:675 start_codon:yes stop_codon:yes gene_type:complete